MIADVTPEQEEEFFTVQDESRSEADYGVAAQPLSEAEVRRLYDGTVDAYECLVDEGYEPTPPVSFEVFLAGYNEGRPTWSPFVVDDGVGTAPFPQHVCQEPDLYDVAPPVP